MSGGRKVNRRIKKYIKQGNRLMREPMGLINVETNSSKQRNKINSSSRLLKKKKINEDLEKPDLFHVVTWGFLLIPAF